MIKIINDDIIRVCNDGYWIAHQCNMVSRYVSGLASDIYINYKQADKRNGTVYNKDKYGKIDYEKFNNFGVINMYAQYLPGGYYVGCDKNNIDKEHNRHNAFKSCLDEIVLLIYKEDIKKLAFPYGIGCGLAKGNWDVYIEMLEQFSKSVEIDVILVSKI